MLLFKSLRETVQCLRAVFNRGKSLRIKFEVFGGKSKDFESITVHSLRSTLKSLGATLYSLRAALN